MRAVRWVLLGCFGLGLVVLLAGAVVRSYLTSSEVAGRAANLLARHFGAPVHVAEADLNLDTTTLGGVKLFERELGPDAPPWATAGILEADVPLADTVRGIASPNQVRLHDASITLRFDEAGHLLTHLPRRKKGERLPVIRIHSGRLTLKQIGKPDFVVTGIQATLHPEQDELILTGTGVDPRWGQWHLGGGLDPVEGRSWLDLKSAGVVDLKDEALQGLPFVAARVWDHVRADGRSAVALSVDQNPALERVQYRVDLDAEKVKLHVIDIDLHAEAASGQVTIENGVVTLRNVRGKTGDGDIWTEGVLDFRATPTRLAFDVKVERVDIHQLPRKWPLPRFVEGRLTGQARLVVTVDQGKPKTVGQGEGEVSEVPVFGKKATIPLRLNADEKGFHFLPRWPKTG